LSIESYNGREIAQLMSEVTGLEIKCAEKGFEKFEQLIEAWIAKENLICCVK
jgi:NAD(P)H dehydrogenase (quinone)